MSLNLVSPGTKVREVDLTIGRVDAINEQVGAIAGPFEKGPVDVPTLIETEQDLLATFGEPKEDDAQYEYWMTASSYLSYGGVLRVVRADSSTLNNANDKSATVKIKNYEDYVNSYSNATSFNYASKYPGRCLNDLKVCVIDDFADQRISVGSGVTAGMVGLGVTQAIDGRLEVGSGTTSSASGFLRGVITAVDTTNNTVDVKIVDKVSTSNVSTAATYKQGSTSAFIAPVTTTTSTSLGIATVTGQINEAFDASISGIATANIQLGDVVSKTAGTSVVAAGTTVIGIGASIISVDKAITGISTAGAMTTFKFERTSSTSTTQYPIKVVTTASATNATFKQVFANSWIYNTSCRYFLEGQSFNSASTFTTKSKIDRSSLKKGDIVEVVRNRSNNVVAFNNGVLESSILQITGDNTVQLSDSLSVEGAIDLRRKLNYAKSTAVPLEVDNISSLIVAPKS